MRVSSSLLHAALRRRRPDYDATAEATAPTLRLHDLIFIGVGCTLGSGLFLLTGHVARNIAGPAIVLSYLLAAFACLLSALSYAEMSSRLSCSGGAYAFSYLALGELPAFLIGMCLTLEYGVSTAAVARSWASYLGDALTFLPPWATGNKSQFSVLGAFLIAIITVLLSTGMRQAKWIINTCTMLYSLLVVVIVAVGLSRVNSANWHPFFPFGTTGVITGASTVFFSFIGFDEVATLSEEAHAPHHTVPMAILLSMLVVTGMYFAASLVLSGMVPREQLDVGAPFSAAMRHVGLPIMAKFVGLGTAFGMMNSALVGFAAQPRIFFAMGRDGLLPRVLALSTGKTTFVCGAAVGLLALVIRTEQLADVVSGGTLLAFLATNLSVLLTRARIHAAAPAAPRLLICFVLSCAFVSVGIRFAAAGSISTWLVAIASLPVILLPLGLLLREEFAGGALHERDSPAFLCPAVPVLPLAGSFTTVFLISQLSVQALGALFSWLAVSTVFYALYGARNARLASDYNAVAPADGDPDRDLGSLDYIAMEADSLSDGDEFQDRHEDIDGDEEFETAPWVSASKKPLCDADKVSTRPSGSVSAVTIQQESQGENDKG